MIGTRVRIQEVAKKIASRLEAVDKILTNSGTCMASREEFLKVMREIEDINTISYDLTDIIDEEISSLRDELFEKY